MLPGVDVEVAADEEAADAVLAVDESFVPLLFVCAGVDVDAVVDFPFCAGAGVLVLGSFF